MASRGCAGPRTGLPLQARWCRIAVAWCSLAGLPNGRWLTRRLLETSATLLAPGAPIHGG